MAILSSVALLFCAGSLVAQTTDNDDSCDIGNAPAATLLLPYFEVDLGLSGTGRTTLFSVTNVSPYSQIAHVTLWTDWAFPVLDFNLFLTGYDVQPINLYDVIARGLIGGTTGTGLGSPASPNARSSTGTRPNEIGGPGATGTNGPIGRPPFSTATFGGNPNFLASAATNCAPGRLPGQIPSALSIDVRALLSTGRSTGASISCQTAAGSEGQVGGNHGGKTAIGYATIDVVATCSATRPIDPSYYTDELLFDNVFIGDYQDVNQNTTAGNYAGGNSMVHIRAIPEGGAAGVPAVATKLPFTFYDRYTIGTIARTFDRRQPLPSAYAARWVSGSSAAFDTQYKIWREGFTGGRGVTEAPGGPGLFACEDYPVNSAIPLIEVVRFDEHENAGLAGNCFFECPIIGRTTPATSRQAVSNSLFPVVAGSRDVGGWTYLNLSNGGDAVAAIYFQSRPYNAARPGFGSVVGPVSGVFSRDVSQSWLIVSMFAEGRYGVDQDANWLGNGCSAALPASSQGKVGSSLGRVAPAGGVLVCSPPNPPGTGTAPSPDSSAALQCAGSNVNP